MENKISDETSFLGPTYPLLQFKSDVGGHFGFTIDVQGAQMNTFFDTGATDTVFDIEFVKAHPESFEFIKELPVREGSNQTIKAGMYRAKAIKFASVEEKDVEVYVLSLKALQARIPGIQAIIGLNQMFGHKWYFNNKKAVWGIY